MSTLSFYWAMLSSVIAPVGTRVGIRCGDQPQYTDSFGKIWLVDQYSYVTTGPVLTYGYEPAIITGTPDPQLYKYIRYGDSIAFGAPVVWGYNVPVTPGTYTVKLLYAELFSDPGRIGHVDINGVRKLTNFNETAAAGGGNQVAYQMIFTDISPVGGFINVGITSITNNFYISGLEFVP